MTFLIEYLDEPRVYERDLDQWIRYGRLIFGDFEERFATPLPFWTESEYERQWGEGVRRLVNQRENSALITSIYEEKEHGVGWYPLYLLGDEVAIQDQVLLPEIIGPEFDTDPYASVGEWLADEGVPEWRVPVSSLRQFLERRS